MFDKVASLLHDLDEGMRPLSVIAPHFPTAYHRKRDRCVCRSLHQWLVLSVCKACVQVNAPVTSIGNGFPFILRANFPLQVGGNLG